jgi:hypothetical protein
MKQALEVTMNIIEGEKYGKKWTNKRRSTYSNLGKELKNRRSENTQKY